nr:DUF559 domain-containing protein [Schaalia odontolytica]
MDQQRGAHAHNEDAALLRDRVASIRASLVIADSHAASERIHRRVQKGEFIRLLTGIYIPSARLIGLHSRQRKTAVFVARLCALSLRYPDYVISGGVAAYLLDLPTDDQIEKLTLYAPSRECPRQIHFPAITVEKNERFSAVTTTVSRPRSPVPSINYLDFRIATPSRVVVDCARLLADKHGFSIACAGLAHACHFDRFRQAESRVRQEEARKEFHEALANTPLNTVGRERARWIIDRADAGCESPGEALVLLALLRAGINGMTTQEEVHIDGHAYFIDIALPDLKIAIEFDGRIKYGDTVDEVHDSIEAEQRRQRDLERDGWTVIRVRWSDLRVIDEVVAQVLVAIRAKKGN